MKRTIGTETDDTDSSTETESLIGNKPGRTSAHGIENSSIRPTSSSLGSGSRYDRRTWQLEVIRAGKDSRPSGTGFLSPAVMLTELVADIVYNISETWKNFWFNGEVFQNTYVLNVSSFYVLQFIYQYTVNLKTKNPGQFN